MINRPSAIGREMLSISMTLNASPSPGIRRPSSRPATMAMPIHTHGQEPVEDRHLAGDGPVFGGGGHETASSKGSAGAQVQAEPGSTPDSVASTAESCSRAAGITR